MIESTQTPPVNDTQDSNQPSTKPMVPIGEIIEKSNLLPDPPTPEQERATLNRLSHLLRPGSSTYAMAILGGFTVALVLIAAVLCYLVIKTLM